MELILEKDNKTLKFVSGSQEVNVNDDLVQIINVIPELPLDSTENLWVAFEKDSVVAFTLPLLGNNGKYTSDIPYDIVRDGGQWAFQILRRRYQTPERVGTYRQTASNKYVFTVCDGVKTEDGELVTTTMLTTLYRKVGEDVETVTAAKTETETNKTQAAQSAAASANSAAKAEQAKDTAIAVAGTVRETAEMVAKETVQSVYSEVRDIARDEIAKYDFIKVISALPDEGMPNRIYLIPKPDGDIADLFEMWLWVNKGTDEKPSYSWEYEGLKTGEIELVDYVKFTDYANTTKPGVVRTYKGFGVMTNSGGYMYIDVASKDNIEKRNSLGSDYDYTPLSVKTLDYAVKVGITTNTETLTDEEKASACEWLGAVKAFDGSKETGDLRWSVYCQHSGVQAQRPLSSSPKETAIAVYGSGGTLTTNLVRNPKDCTNKEYVDGLIEKLSSGGGGKLYAHKYSAQYIDNMWYDGTECNADIFFYSTRSTKFNTLDELKAYMAEQSYIPTTGYGWGTVNPEIITIGNVQLPVYCLHKENGEIKIKLYMDDVNYGSTVGTITRIYNGVCWEV
jgi:hypothetical protein